ncbi:thioesterase II family protein [Candidatus Uabimicrobium sp. HlEnr_7]|uniref:thioesterase II family protein n=1 Tax=Candidatus Uabimicrobium helgolandensis TaxID=3095367 RepID=UPI003556292F
MKKIIARNPWLLCHENKEATLRLFCFPYAGGSATVFRKWSESLPENVEVCAIQLPGRGSRLRESLHTNMNELVSDLKTAITDIIDEMPFAFLGHSMGALVAFELSHILESSPSHLFVSGHRAPQLPTRFSPIFNLSEEQFLSEIKSLGGMQPQILENRELMNLLLPSLRGDFEVCDTYVYNQKTRLDFSITAMAGINDPRANKEETEQWQEQTNDSFAFHMLPGDHFFLDSHANLYFEILNRELYNYL